MSNSLGCRNGFRLRAFAEAAVGGGGNNGRIIERYARIPGVGTVTLRGNADSGALCSVIFESLAGRLLSPNSRRRNPRG